MGPGTVGSNLNMSRSPTTTTRPNTQISVEPSPAPAQTTSVVEPTLITEQEVMFSTAAAVACLPAKTHRWTDAFGAALRAVAGPSPPHPVRAGITLSVTPISRTP